MMEWRVLTIAFNLKLRHYSQVTTRQLLRRSSRATTNHQTLSSKPCPRDPYACRRPMSWAATTTLWSGQGLADTTRHVIIIETRLRV